MKAKPITSIVAMFVLVFLVQITAVTAEVIWTDDFESYPPGSFPGPDWTSTGSGAIYVDSSISSEGENSLRFHGSPGGCFESIPCRPLELSTTEGFVISFSVYVGSDHAQGCHSWTGGAGLMNECDWGTGQGASIVSFWYDGTIDSRIGNLGTYSSDTWYEIKMEYERVDASSVQLTYWIDGDFKGTQTVPTFPYEDDLVFFHGSSGDGTVWFDDIRVTSLSSGIEGNILLKGQPPTGYVVCYQAGQSAIWTWLNPDGTYQLPEALEQPFACVLRGW